MSSEKSSPVMSRNLPNFARMAFMSWVTTLVLTVLGIPIPLVFFSASSMRTCASSTVELYDACSSSKLSSQSVRSSIAAFSELYMSSSGMCTCAAANGSVLPPPPMPPLGASTVMLSARPVRPLLKLAPPRLAPRRPPDMLPLRARSSASCAAMAPVLGLYSRADTRELWPLGRAWPVAPHPIANDDVRLLGDGDGCPCPAESCGIDSVLWRVEWPLAAGAGGSPSPLV
mmetsp:Transcript_34874/g.110158  ORF Transcript_34874/g.110158 Transcript_34874/m.110158 type:complete len:229 (+) Transcript_34874:2385-3071(+)